MPLPLPAPHPAVTALDAASRKRFTPCGRGRLVWRQWGYGPPLVLFHGGSGSWMHWMRNIECLARHHSVWVPDLPGMGESDYPLAADFPVITPEESDIDITDSDGLPPSAIPMQTHVAVMIEGLSQLFGATPVPVVGFSFGGTLSANVAALVPGRFSRVILVGSGGVPGERPVRPEMISWRQIADAEELAAVHRRNLAIHLIVDPGNVDEMAVNIQTLNTGRFRGRRLQRRQSLFEVLARGRPRLAGIWGRHDHTARGRVGELAGILRGIDPDAPFHVVEKGGHWVAYECADEVNRTLLRFLAEQTTDHRRRTTETAI
jgi:2-hydroxy-6-oxonona-2,4-dienedioate hydrolase